MGLIANGDIEGQVKPYIIEDANGLINPYVLISQLRIRR